MSSANLHESIPVSGSGDELDQLAHTLNAMMARIREGVVQMHRFNENAAHELRTPLHRIGSQLDAALSRPRDAASYRATLQGLQAEASSLAGAVNALLRLSQMQSGLDPAQLEPVELTKLLRTLLEFFAPLAERRGIQLAIREPLPNAVIRGDASWLQRLFSNLLDNALKYCDAGDSVHIAALVSAGRATVAVEDTGPGIPQSELPGLFERFARGSQTCGRAGFGLGLALAREIARAHDGAIAVESEPGRGARFCVMLPLFETQGSRTSAHFTRAGRDRTRGVRRRLHESALRRR